MWPGSNMVWSPAIILVSWLALTWGTNGRAISITSISLKSPELVGGEGEGGRLDGVGKAKVLGAKGTYAS